MVSGRLAGCLLCSFIVALLVVVYSQSVSTDPKSGQVGVRGFWRALSWLLGWCYFLAWSLSFYPQLVLNAKRQSTQGLSYNFVWLNLLGFSCYSVFNVLMFFDEDVRESYRRANPEHPEVLVRANDVFFAVHATGVTAATLVQMYMCGYKRSPGRQVWVSVGAFLLVAIGVSCAYLVGVLAKGNPLWEPGGNNFWNMLSWIYFLSYIKLAISFFKYLPQVWLNYRLKSTRGWSLVNVLLDLTGGTLSFVQLFIDASLASDWKGVVGNPVKLGLSILSLVFDFIFIFQHYVLYKDAPDDSTAEEQGFADFREETRPLTSH